MVRKERVSSPLRNRGGCNFRRMLGIELLVRALRGKSELV
jgi:hypothetical protein